MASLSSAREIALPGAREQALSALRVLFPTADCLYLAECLDYHLSASQSYSSTTNGKGRGAGRGANELIEEISQKMLFSNFGQYPQVVRRAGREGIGEMEVIKSVWKGVGSSGVRIQKRNQVGEVDFALTKNLALARLHEIFPTTSIEVLKTQLDGLRHSHLFETTEQLLSRNTPRPPLVSSPFRTRLFGPPSPPASDATLLPVLTPKDLYRSPNYVSSLVLYGSSLYPKIPLSVVESLVADYTALEDLLLKLKEWEKNQSRVAKWFRGILGSPSSVNSLHRTTLDQELLDEIYAAEEPIRAARIALDEIFARNLNLVEAERKGETFECECCYAIVAFEDIVCCGRGDHSYCRGCLSSQITELVYGAGVLQVVSRTTDGRIGGEGSGVRCLSGDECGASFSLESLERAIDRSLFIGLEKRLGEIALESITRGRRGWKKEGLVRCPFCGYSEVTNDNSIYVKAFPILNSDISLLYSPLTLPYSLVSLVVLSILFILILPVAFALPGLFVSSKVEEGERLYLLLEPGRVVGMLSEYLEGRGRSLRGGNHIFRCRNGPSSTPNLSLITSHTDLLRTLFPASVSPSARSTGNCGKSSCTICERVYLVPHVCFGDEKEGLRLAVEMARSNAVKRSCPDCGISFIKDAGCNRVVCQ